MNLITNFFYLSSGPILVVLLLIVYVALTKKRPSDKLNNKISTNLKEYEIDTKERYKL